MGKDKTPPDHKNKQRQNLKEAKYKLAEFQEITQTYQNRKPALEARNSDNFRLAPDNANTELPPIPSTPLEVLLTWYLLYNEFQGSAFQQKSITGNSKSITNIYQHPFITSPVYSQIPKKVTTESLPTAKTPSKNLVKEQFSKRMAKGIEQKQFDAFFLDNACKIQANDQHLFWDYFYDEQEGKKYTINDFFNAYLTSLNQLPESLKNARRNSFLLNMGYVHIKPPLAEVVKTAISKNLNLQYHKKIISALKNQQFNEIDNLIKFAEKNSKFIMPTKHFRWDTNHDEKNLKILDTENLENYLFSSPNRINLYKKIFPLIEKEISTKLINASWKKMIDTGDYNKQIIDLLLNQDIPPAKDNLMKLIDKHSSTLTENSYLNYQLFEAMGKRWPNIYTAAILDKGVIRYQDHKLLKSLITYIANIDEVYKDDLQQTTTLLHSCAKTNNLAAGEILINCNAKIDLALPNGDTPLAIALTNKHFDFAWMLVNQYHTKGISISEEYAFNLLDYIKRAYEQTAEKKFYSSTTTLFYGAKEHYQYPTAILIIIAIISYLLGRPSEKTKFFKQAFAMFSLLSKDLISYIAENEENLPDVKDPFSLALAFPPIIMNDGKSYSNFLILKGSKLNFQGKPFDFSTFRLNINLTSYLKLKIKELIENDQNLEKIKRDVYIKELDNFSNKFGLLKSIDECLKDPTTKDYMKKACVGKDGRSYEGSHYASRESSFIVVINGKEQTIYRNLELQEIIDKHKNEKSKTLSLK